MYEKIERWYKQGLWSETMVKNAANKGVITEVEADMIIWKNQNM